MVVLTRSLSRSFPSSAHPPLTDSAVNLIIICWIFTPISVIIVCLRLWARRIKSQHLVFNDWAIVAAVLLNCAQSGLLTYTSITGGVGYHVVELQTRYPLAVKRLLQCYFAAEPLWIATNSMVKLSILDLYVRVFAVRNFRRICYGSMGLVAAYWLSTFVRMFFLCSPLTAFWDPVLLVTVPEAYCLDLPATYLSVSIINLILDFWIVVLPMPWLWHLNLPARKRLMVMGIFGLGIFICVVTGLRIHAVIRLDLSDPSFTTADNGVWSTLEPCLSIINACLPVLQPLRQKLAQLLRSLMKSIQPRRDTASNVKTGESSTRRPSLGPFHGEFDPQNGQQYHNSVPLGDIGGDQDEEKSSWKGTADTSRAPQKHGTRKDRQQRQSSHSDNDVRVTMEWKVHREQLDQP